MVLFGGEVDDVVLSSSWIPVEAWASLAACSLMFSWQMQDLAKAKQFLDLTRKNNIEDLLPQRQVGSHVAASVVTFCAGKD